MLPALGLAPQGGDGGMQERDAGAEKAQRCGSQVNQDRTGRLWWLTEITAGHMAAA